MVIPDRNRWEQDRAPGMVRELHQTLADRARAVRSFSGIDFDALAAQPNVLFADADGGYVVGVPFGRVLRVYFEFADEESIRQSLADLLNDLGELATRRTGTVALVLDYDNHAARHNVHPVLLGADFPEPAMWSLLRCRDLREVALPDAPAGISVRPATAADLTAITGLEQRALEDAASMPPVPDGFLEEARWLGLAEADGAVVGYLRVLDAEKRGLHAETLVVAPDVAAEAVTAALLRAAYAYGRDAAVWGQDTLRRAFTLRVPAAAAADPVLARFGFKRHLEGMTYRRLADPAEVLRLRVAKVVPSVQVGKIWGRF